MIDWPICALILTPITGIVVLLLNRVLGNEKMFHAQWKIVLFILAATTFQVAILGREFWGVSASGLFRLDGLNTHLAFCFLIYTLFSHVTLRFDAAKFETETGILQLGFVFSGLMLILANSLILYALAAPLVFLIAGVASLCNETSSKEKGFKAASVGALVSLVVFTLSAAAVGQSADTLDLKVLSEKILTAQKDPQFYIGWAMHAMMCLCLLLLPPTSLFLERYEKSESWSLTGFFRMSMPLLGTLLFSKWIFLTGISWDGEGGFKSILDIPSSNASGIIAGLVFLAATVVLLMTEKALLFVQALLVVNLASGVMTTLLGNSEGFIVAQSGLYIFVFCSTLLHMSLATLKISTSATLSELRDALQNAPVSVQLGTLFAILGSAPYMTFVGFDLNKKLIERARLALDVEGITALISIVLMGISTIVICNRIAELYFGNAKRNSRWDERAFADKMWSYALMAILLILGIYPTPLYKYLSHSINLFVNNA